MELFKVNEREKNTARAAEIAIKRAKELGTDIIAASTSGKTALYMEEAAERLGFTGKLIIVTHAYGSKAKGQNIMPEETRALIAEKGAVIVTAAHALSGGERGISTVMKGIYPLEIVAATLRLISAGVKVCLEIGLMAMDAGAIEYRKPVVCVGGTGGGADTVCVVTPAYSSNMLDSRINEILCKPDLYE